MSKNLPIYHINEANLKGFTTTEKDKKRGVDRMPPIEFRNRKSDIVQEEAVDEKSKPENIDFEQGKALRDQQYNYTKDYQGNAEEDDPDEEENEVKKSVAMEPSRQIFKRHNKEDAVLEDF